MKVLRPEAVEIYNERKETLIINRFIQIVICRNFDAE